MLVLLRFLTILGILWLVRRIVSFISGRPAKGEAPGARSTAATNTVKDPVCGMYMDPRLGIRVWDQDKELYFCSEECRQQFFDRPS